MADYIDRDAATARVKKQMNREPTFGPWAENDRIAKVCYGIVIEALERLPSADVKPVVHGKWELTTEQIGFPKWNCSCCGGEGRGDYSVCPWCGADMRGNDNERE